MTLTCPYCDGGSVKDAEGYCRCDNGHVFHVDDWNSAQLSEGTTL